MIPPGEIRSLTKTICFIVREVENSQMTICRFSQIQLFYSGKWFPRGELTSHYKTVEFVLRGSTSTIKQLNLLRNTFPPGGIHLHYKTQDFVIRKEILYEIFGFRFLPYKTIEFVKEHSPPGGNPPPTIKQLNLFYEGAPPL